MATVAQLLSPLQARFLATAFPSLKMIAGTAAPSTGLFFDAASDEAAFWSLLAHSYGSGNLTVDVYWYADTASTGDVVWGAAIAAITANTDTQDVETKALATENTATDTHLGTTGQRLHHIAVTVSNLDTLASGDLVYLRIRRVGTNVADTMAGDAALVYARVTYSDT